MTTHPTSKSSSADDEFFNSVQLNARQIVLDSKVLHELATTQSAIENVIMGVKELSKSLYGLVDGVNLYVKRYNEQRNITSPSVQQQFVIDSSQQVLDQTLEFITACRSVFSNPFDFLSRQILDNTLKQLTQHIRTLMTSITSLKSSLLEDDEDNNNNSSTSNDNNTPEKDDKQHNNTRERSGSYEGSFFIPGFGSIDVLRDAEAAREASQQMQAAVRQREGSLFGTAARRFIGAVNRLLEIIKALEITTEDPQHLREAVKSMVSAGKAVMTSPQNDDIFEQAFADAEERLQQALKSFLFVCSQTTGGRASIRASVKLQTPPPQERPSPPDRPLPDRPHNAADRTPNAPDRERPPAVPERPVNAEREKLKERLKEIEKEKLNQRDKANTNGLTPPINPLHNRTQSVSNIPPTNPPPSRPGSVALRTSANAAQPHHQQVNHQPTNHHQPTNNHQQPTNNHQQPTNNHQPITNSPTPSTPLPSVVEGEAHSPGKIRGERPKSRSNPNLSKVLVPTGDVDSKEDSSGSRIGWERAEPPSSPIVAVSPTIGAHEIARRHATRVVLNPAVALAGSPSALSPLNSPNLSSQVSQPPRALLQTSPAASNQAPGSPMMRSMSGSILQSKGASTLSSNAIEAGVTDTQDISFMDIAGSVTSFLCEQYGGFREEWAKQTNDKRDNTLSKVAEIVQRASESPALKFPRFTPPPPPPQTTTNNTNTNTISNTSGNGSGSGSAVVIRTLLDSQHTKTSPAAAAAGGGGGGDGTPLSQLKNLMVMNDPQEWLETSKVPTSLSSTSTYQRSQSAPLSPMVKSKRLNEFVKDLSNSLKHFLDAVNGTVLNNSSPIQSSALETMGQFILKMKEVLKEAVDTGMKEVSEGGVSSSGSSGSPAPGGVSLLLSPATRSEVTPTNSDDSRALKIKNSLRWGEKKPEKAEKTEKEKVNIVALVEFLQRILATTLAVLEDMPTKGKIQDSMVKSLSRVTHNYINVKLKLEETLLENIYIESTLFRSFGLQIVVELNASAQALVYSELNTQVALFQLAANSRLFSETLGKILDSIATLRYISSSQPPVEPTSTPSGTLKITDDEEHDVNLWDDRSEVLHLEGGVFRAGNLNKIVENLTSDESYDNKFLSTFIATYQSFTTPAEFFAKLLQRYHVPVNRVDEKRTKAIKMRVCIVMRYFIENQFIDLDRDMVAKFFDFIDNTLPFDGNAEVARPLKKHLTTKVNELTARKNSMMISSPSLTELQDCTNISVTGLIMNSKEIDVAKQLTLIEFGMFCRIQPAELINQAWNGSVSRQRAPHVVDLIQRTNRLSFWIASLLLWQPTQALRLKMLTKTISIGAALKELNNYNTLMGVVAGLSMSCINRLKITFSQLDKKSQDTLEKLQEILNPCNSFKNYRQELHNGKQPCLPYLGTYLSDLTFMEDGNPDHVKGVTSGKQLINFTKRELVNNVIMEIKLYQQSTYQFTPMEPLKFFLEALPCTEEKELFDLSLLREPRNR